MKYKKLQPRFFKKVIYLYFSTFIVFIFMIVINIMMYMETNPKVHPIAEYTSSSPKKEYAIVLGASVRGNRLSMILRHRVDAAIVLYRKGLVKKILMSGDGIDINYNEPKAMKLYAMRQGVPANVIFTDKSGFDTYHSILRSKLEFNIQNAYIVSQPFHTGRAIWIAKHIDIQANGVTVGEFKPFSYYTFREFFARFKDFWQMFFKMMLHQNH